jgi:hypothetical protein
MKAAKGEGTVIIESNKKLDSNFKTQMEKFEKGEIKEIYTTLKIDGKDEKVLIKKLDD